VTHRAGGAQHDPGCHQVADPAAACRDHAGQGTFVARGYGSNALLGAGLRLWLLPLVSPAVPDAGS